MSEEIKMNIEVDRDELSRLFELAGLPLPDNVSSESIKNLTNTLKDKISLPVPQSPTTAPQSSAGAEEDLLKGGEREEGKIRQNTVLIVDDLGIITYQLEMLFKKLGFEVTISQEINDAIDKFKKQDFGYAIIDLFIPTEREGFILLDEIKKLTLLCKLNTKIIVMTASSKQEYKEKSLNRGANAYVEKTPGWQKQIIEECGLE